MLRAPPDTAVPRPRLIEKMAPPGSKLTYIHADAGYGKTTLLMQYARGRRDVVWLSLDERDGDAPYFLRHLEDAIRKKLPRFDFYTTDLLPFAAGDTFIPTALSALLKAVGRRKLTLILDDVHVLAGGAATDLLIRLARSCPPTAAPAGGHVYGGLLPGDDRENPQSDLVHLPVGGSGADHVHDGEVCGLWKY